MLPLSSGADLLGCMLQQSIEGELVAILADYHEHHPGQFITLPKQTVDCSSARIVLAELRNEGYVEEQQRGIVRLTNRGYHAYQRAARLIDFFGLHGRDTENSRDENAAPRDATFLDRFRS